MTALRVARAGLTGTPVTTTALRVARAGLSGTVAVLLNPIANQTVDPVAASTVTLTAVLTAGGSADSYTWRRVSGAAVTLSPAGATCTFLTPNAMPPAGTSVIVGVTATKSGVTSPERQATITVLPCLRWVYNGAGFVGVVHTRL